MASTTPDRELSEAAFHSKYGFAAGWDDARDMVWSAMIGHRDDERAYAVLRELWESMHAVERENKQDAYVNRIEGLVP